MNNHYVIIVHVIVDDDIVATMTDIHVIIEDHAAAIIHHHATIIIVYPVRHNYPVRRNYPVRHDYRIGDIGPLDHRSGRDGHCDLVEQRFTMAESVEIQANQASPVAFHDEQMLLVVVTPDLAALDLVAAGVDNAELVAILHHGRIVDLHFDV
jgi:hypothetical protein